MTRREQMIIFRGKRIDNGEWVCGFITGEKPEKR